MWREPVRGLVRILVSKLIEPEPAAPRDLSRARDCGTMQPKEPRHLRRRFQVPLSVRFQPQARLGDGAALADAGDDVLQRSTAWYVIEHVVGGDQRHAAGLREAGQASEPFAIVATIEMRAREIGAIIGPRAALPLAIRT